MVKIPGWIWVAVPAVALMVLGTAYVARPDMTGRADDCLGNTTPIQRGVMVNRCDHPISVMTCPQGAGGDDCTVQDIAPAASFGVRADIPVIAHACSAPYLAVMAENEGARRCRAPQQ